MRDPREVISRARAGPAPSGWRVFTKKRGAIGAFFKGTARDPDPLLVLTPEAVIEYASEKKPLAVIFFDELSDVRLCAEATTTSDSMHAWLHVWLDVYDLKGKKAKWQSLSFKDNLEVIQCFIEHYGIHKALSARR